MRAGDHVKVLRAGLWDHAIHVGDRTVLRFEPGSGVSRLPYGRVVAGAERVERVIHRERTYRPPAVVARAFSRIDPAFRAMFESAEQFACWCESGRLPAVDLVAPRPAAPARARRPGPGRRAKARRRAAPRAARPARPRKAVAGKRKRGIHKLGKGARRSKPSRRPAARRRAKPGARRRGRHR